MKKYNFGPGPRVNSEANGEEGYTLSIEDER